jgi:hypothetical protein
LSRSAAALLCLALSFLAMPALAEPRRVAVLEPDLELLRALDLALSPWGVETIRSDAPAASSAAEAIRVASEQARQLDVQAVVWISQTERGSLLWVFDADTDEVSTRMLASAPPFDGAAAAAVALSVKTVLRASQVAPPAERFGAQAPRPPPSVPSPPPAPPAETQAAGAHTVALELGAALALRERNELEPRLELAPVVWFNRYFGVSLEASAGWGTSVRPAGYRGRYGETAVGGEARLRFFEGSGLSAAVSLGGAAHFATLRGAVDGYPQQTVRRVNGSIEAEAFASVSVGGGVYLGLNGGGAYFPAYRRYLVRGTPIFTPGPFVVSFGGYCGLEID